MVGLNKVTTIGQLEGNRWEVVLVDDNALKKITDMVTIDIKGVAVDVSAFRRQPRRLRVTRMPMCISSYTTKCTTHIWFRSSIAKVRYCKRLP